MTNRVQPYVACLLACLLSPIAIAADDPWAPLGLETTRIVGVPVHYTPSLEPGLDDLADAMDEWLPKLQRTTAEVRAFADKSEPILADLNRIVGYDPEEHGDLDQPGILRAFLLTLPILGLDGADEIAPLYLIEQESIRTYLREGGELPDFTYDPTTDSVTFRWTWHGAGNSATGMTTNTQSALVIPVADAEDVAEQATSVFRTFHRPFKQSNMIHVALHETIEFTLLHRMNMTQTNGRWFMDGYADALADYLMREHVAPEATADFRSGDLERYADLASEANLLSWRMSPTGFDLPVDSEQRLRQARYTFAMHEAMGRVQRHGPGHVGIVLDRVANQEGRDSEALLDAMQAVIDEDVAEQLRAYQPFATAEQGIDLYRSRIDEAVVASDAAAELHARLRLFELTQATTGREVTRISRLLRRLGAADAAIKPFDQMLAMYQARRGRSEEALQRTATAIHGAAIAEAHAQDALPLAYAHAEALLEIDSDNVLAFHVRLHQQVGAHDWDAAEATARHILERAPDDSSTHEALDMIRRARQLGDE